MNYDSTQLSIYMNLECNIRCPYCCIKHRNTHIRLDYLNKLHKFNNLKYILLVGGEPGLLKYEDLLYVIKFIKNNLSDVSISIGTNGLLLDKYPSILDQDVTILYHVNHPNLFKHIENSKINNHVVLAKSNIEAWYDFILSNVDVYFNVATDINSSSIVKKPILFDFIKLPNIKMLTINNIARNILLANYLNTRKQNNISVDYKCENLNLFD